MDVGTGLAVLGSANIVGKILGPTAGYLGEGLKTWTERRINNLNRIFEAAARRLGEKLDEPGAVPPRVLKGILTDGSFCEDALSAEYFGGILASSRSGVARDDRGAAFVELLSRLTTYEIRAHYVFYACVKLACDGGNVLTSENRRKARIFIGDAAWFRAMGVEENEDWPAIKGHVLFGLSAHELIGPEFGAGTIGSLREDTSFLAAAGQVSESDVPDANGAVFEPTYVGAELFLWAHGCSQVGVHRFLAEDFSFSQSPHVQLDECAIRRVQGWAKVSGP